MNFASNFFTNFLPIYAKFNHQNYNKNFLSESDSAMKGKKLRFCLNQSEVDLLARKPANLRDQGIIIMGLYCGFRISETTNLQWNWIDNINESISIKENLKPIKWNPKY